MSLQIRLLGQFSLILDDANITGTTPPRMQEVAAWLILHRVAPSPRRIVASALWPDVRDEQALKNLRTLLTRLRSTHPQLGAYLHATGDTLQWRQDADCTVDLLCFEQARAQARAAAEHGQDEQALRHFAEACDAYAGALLPGQDSEWLYDARERLHRAWLDTLHQYASLLVRRGAHVRAQEVARQLQHADPLHENAHAILMQTQLALGDRAGALRTYHAFATLLRDELGVEPGIEMQSLYETALFEDSALQGSREAIKFLYALWNVWNTPTPRT